MRVQDHALEIEGGAEPLEPVDARVVVIGIVGYCLAAWAGIGVLAGLLG